MPDIHKATLEAVIRDLIADLPGLHVRAYFYRGATGQTGPLGPWTRFSEAETDGCGNEWFVMLRPSSFDVVVSAAGRYLFGAHDIIGDPIAVKLPQTSPGVVDMPALSGSALHVELLAAIRRQAAVVEQMRAAVGA